MDWRCRRRGTLDVNRQRGDSRLSNQGNCVVERTTHPGEVLAENLAQIGITPTELARLIHVPPNRITQIIHGRRNITGDTALRLGHWFGNSAEFWLNLQNAYDIRVANEKAGKDIARLPVRADKLSPGGAGPRKRGQQRATIGSPTAKP